MKTSGIHGGYRLVSTYDLPDCKTTTGGGYSRVNFGHLKSEVFRNGGGGYSGVNFGHLKSEVFQNGGGGVFWSKLWSSQIWSFPKWGGYSGVNFGHLKSEVFQNGGGVFQSKLWWGGTFWSEIPERGFLENLGKNLLFSQKPACASQIVSHILRMWRLIRRNWFIWANLMSM